MSGAKRIDTDELKAWLNENREFHLIDVLPEEYYRKEHLPGAENACVYSVEFIDEVKKLGARADDTLVVYGSSSDSFASATAAEKLVRAGYQHVFDYRAGTAGWRQAGHELEGAGATQRETKIGDKIYKVDLEKSRVEWTGRNISGPHSGTIQLKEGEVRVRDGQPANGRFVMDMETIANTDIEDSTMKQVLVDHLKSDDFFDVNQFPTAQFILVEMRPLADAKAGAKNYSARGELTIKDVTREITFPAVVELKEDGSVAIEAHFDIDRTQWNITYGSGKFYEKLGKHLVYDDITIGLNILAS